MQAMRLSRWRNMVSPRAPAVLDRIEATRSSRTTPARFLQSDGFSSFRAIHADVLKGMISYRIGFSECEHRRASNGQHVRNEVFNESFPACQALFFRHLGTPRETRKFPPRPVTRDLRRSSWAQEVPMQRSITTIFALLTFLNGSLILIAGPSLNAHLPVLPHTRPSP